MAKRHHKKHKVHHRRRRVGALNTNSPLVKIAAAGLGYVLANKVNAMVDGIVKGKVDTKIVGVAEGGLGAALLMSKGGSTTMRMVKTIAGGVLAGAGVKRLLTAFNVVPAATAVTGYGSVPVIGNYSQVPVIGKRMGAGPGYTPSGTLGAYSIPSGRMNQSKVMGSVDGSTLLGSN